MKFCIILAVLSRGINLLSGNVIGICSNTSIGEPVDCCENYRKVGEACEECLPGTFGLNCTGCPPGFYGRFCRESCKQCPWCDPVKGCVNESKYTNINEGVNWLTIAISVTGSCGVSFTFCMFTYCKQRIRTPRCKEYQGKKAKSATKVQISSAVTECIRDSELMENRNEQIAACHEYVHCENYGRYNTLNLKPEKDIDIL